MGVFTDHPHTAITEKIDKIIESDLEPEIELPELLGTIKIQYSGAIEAARAIRKKLKYGELNEQLKSLDVLNAIVANGGKNLEELYNDRKLIERLRLSATDPQINTKLRKKIISYAISWNENFSDKKYYYGIAGLKKQIPSKTYRRKKSTVSSTSGNFMNDEAYASDDDSNTAGVGSSNGSRSGNRSGSQSTTADPNVKYKIPKINLQKESPKIKLLIAEASKASIDLTNSLHAINRSKGEISTDDERSTLLFEKSRIIRRKILRYLQLVDSEEFLGSLIHANEELVAALQKFSELTKPADHDSDDESLSSFESDLESVTDSLASSMIDEHDKKFPNSKRSAPLPPSKLQREATAEGNPFGDSNEVDESVEWK
ncbi:TOM1-like protein 2 [Wickerhamomyces ciferrii]|uniref:TOM1-like protein 2 n=1 Tax=Wickerhamomyces ciferrii (strain ATCC 14091 / BCRC 22168 / CBS 111 / JCM 3599 / NBRC 0793 / NRRL Y-1031 F-60-10) TaxID=1206466 RepID=K0KYC9_WICCF|nr:TOM1-like protein 2 [Wickerhamomyces ciferrii]CCH46449.1 TOM1-like protein 2 [Wickerhamomyces ciferrii]